MTRRPPRPLLVAAAVTGGLLLAGCSPSPQVTPTESVTATPTETATPIALVPDGTAEDNLPYFTQIVEQVWAGPDQVAGRAYIDALTAAGFDKSKMQVTNDESTVGNPAESIQFSVLWGDECLLGQVGPATGNPVTTVQPALLDDTTCLIGDTRAIDW
ncbi:MAG: hypothetical protein QM626_14705 [Microbacterium sp.]|uniref:DUF6993 domain-containing protein n=1 Tax=Microbacterium sp. TaxID=51671 RepID=UPI0039E2AC97